jgi:hypothetical protein
VRRIARPWGLPAEEGWIAVAVLVIGIIAALLVALSLGFALLVELRALRNVHAHANTTRHRVFKVESGRYRKSEQLRGTRAGVRADYEARILTYTRASVAKLESIRALLTGQVLPPSDSDEGHLHSELAPARVAKAAREIKDRRAAQREALAKLPRGEVEGPAAIGSEEDGEAERLTSKLPEEPGAVAAFTETEEELTNVWTAPAGAHGRPGAEAGGATRHPSATPRAALSVAVAPPASAPPSTSPEPAILAAGLGRPKSARVALHAPPIRVRSETLAGMPAPLLAADVGDASDRTSWPSLKGGGVGISTHAPAGPAPVVAVPRFPPTLVSMKAQSAEPAAPTPPRILGSSTHAPLAHPDLIGSEDIADEAAPLRLGPEDKTPPRHGRAAVLMRAFQGPEEGGAA